MIIVPTSTDLCRALEAEGFPLPDECADVSLRMPADGVFQLVYTVNVSGTRLQQLGRALERVGKTHE